MSFLACRMIQDLAAAAGPFCGLMEAYRSGQVDSLLPAFPSRKQWARYGRDHRLLTRELDRAVPGLVGAGDGSAVDVFDSVRAMGRFAAGNPDQCGEAFGRVMTNREWAQWWEIEVRSEMRAYGRHLLQIQSELVEGSGSNAGSFDVCLRQCPAVHYYVKVMLPAMMAYQTTPVRELRVLRGLGPDVERLNAVERLVRLDPLAAESREVGLWWNVDDGPTRSMRRGLVQRWASEGIGHGKFSRVKFKQVIGALIQVVVERLGPYVDFTTPDLKPASINAATVRELFHAVERDRAGRGREASAKRDRDIADLSPSSWATQLRRYRPLWDDLFERPGRLKPE